jgi:hypothetical protein
MPMCSSGSSTSTTRSSQLQRPSSRASMRTVMTRSCSTCSSAEAVSVLCRRATERKANPPDLGRALAKVREWLEGGELAYVGSDYERLFPAILDVIDEPAPYGFLRAE